MATQRALISIAAWVRCHAFAATNAGDHPARVSDLPFENDAFAGSVCIALFPRGLGGFRNPPSRLEPYHSLSFSAIFWVWEFSMSAAWMVCPLPPLRSSILEHCCSLSISIGATCKRVCDLPLQVAEPLALRPRNVFRFSRS